MSEKYYKAFDKNLQCRGMQYEIGKEYTFNGEPIPCQQGFHYCKTIVDCYKFYDMIKDTRICEVEPLGDIVTDDEVKFCTNKIKIVAEIENPRLRSNLSESSTGYCNKGDYNSGDCNTGHWNSGNKNSGNWNSGNRNSGVYNSGACNSGDCNSGDYNNGHCNSGIMNGGNRNTGHKNSGDYNSGTWNTGNRNSGNWNNGAWNSGNYNIGYSNTGNWNSGIRNAGDWNSGDYNSGIFNTSKMPTIKIFDKESDWTYDDWCKSKAHDIMNNCPHIYSDFINESDMADEEKECHPEYKTIGGYNKISKVTPEDKQKWWDGLSESDKQAVYDLPNFDADKFYECTQIRIKEENNDNGTGNNSTKH